MHPLLQACAIVATLIIAVMAYIVATAPDAIEGDRGLRILGKGELRDLRDFHAGSDTVS